MRLDLQLFLVHLLLLRIVSVHPSLLVLNVFYYQPHHLHLQEEGKVSYYKR